MAKKKIRKINKKKNQGEKINKVINQVQKLNPQQQKEIVKDINEINNIKNVSNKPGKYQKILEAEEKKKGLDKIDEIKQENLNILNQVVGNEILNPPNLIKDESNLIQIVENNPVAQQQLNNIVENIVENNAPVSEQQLNNIVKNIVENKPKKIKKKMIKVNVVKKQRKLNNNLKEIVKKKLNKINVVKKQHEPTHMDKRYKSIDENFNVFKDIFDKIKKVKSEFKIMKPKDMYGKDLDNVSAGIKGFLKRINKRKEIAKYCTKKRIVNRAQVNNVLNKITNSVMKIQNNGKNLVRLLAEKELKEKTMNIWKKRCNNVFFKNKKGLRKGLGKKKKIKN